MTRYASSTSVSVSKSKDDIERTLTRYGANKFASLSSIDMAMIQFEMNDRVIRFSLNLPNLNDDEFCFTPERRNPRDSSAKERLWEQACRQRWRALNLVIKAKLEAIDSEITEFDQEFMAHIVLPDGRTMSDALIPQMATMLETGSVPKLLPGF